MSNREINKTTLNQLLSNEKDSGWRDKVEYRKTNRVWLKKSAKIAIKLNRFLKESKTTQKQFATKLGVSPQQVNKILKGTENLTLETITKIEITLGVELVTILGTNEIIADNSQGAFKLLAQEILQKLQIKLQEVLESQKQFEVKFEKEELVKKEPLENLKRYASSTQKKNKGGAKESNYAMAA